MAHREAVHGLSHPGRKPYQRPVAAKFVWHGLKKDVRAWTDACVHCQCTKVHRHTKTPLAKMRFDHVNPYPPPMVSHTSSPWLTGTHGGQKLFHCPQ